MPVVGPGSQMGWPVKRSGEPRLGEDPTQTRREFPSFSFVALTFPVSGNWETVKTGKLLVYKSCGTGKLLVCKSGSEIETGKL